MEFPPLPPSPVEEADEESSDVGQSAVIPSKSKNHSNRTMEYRPRVPPHRTPVVDSKEQVSLNTRSMDAGFTRGRRAPGTNNSRREVSLLEKYTRACDFLNSHRDDLSVLLHFNNTSYNFILIFI